MTSRGMTALPMMTLFALLSGCGAPPGVSLNSGSTVPFGATQTTATRLATHAGCMEIQVPFSRDDRFSIQTLPVEQEVRSIAISVTGSTALHQRTPLQVLSPNRTLQQAQSNGGALGVVLFGDMLSLKFEGASIEVERLPEHEGDVLTVRALLNLVDGRALDVTLSEAVVSTPGACGEGS